jgi:hypothetical protein
MARTATRGGLALLAVALAACGGSSARPTPHFAAIADTICVQANAEVAALPAARTTLAGLALEAQRELSIVRAELSQLAQLTAPVGDQGRFATALATTRDQLVLISRLIAAVRSDNEPKVVSLAFEGNTIDARVRVAMRAAGLSDCAEAVEPRGGGARRRAR